MSMMDRGNWEPWRQHDGSCMPIRVGVLVQVRTPSEKVPSAIGITGVDFRRSWFWTERNKGLLDYLPIEEYRVYEQSLYHHHREDAEVVTGELV